MTANPVTFMATLKVGMKDLNHVKEMEAKTSTTSVEDSSLAGKHSTHLC
jgi:hypothetical protein